MPAQRIIFTDLDGTLLDHHTYSWDAARPALDAARAAGVPVVICTSKTRAEVEPLRFDMGIQDPFIVENGGAVVFAEGTLVLGATYDVLCEALRVASAATGVGARGFSAMSVEEVSQLTGLPASVTRLSMQREYDEPFVVEDEAGTGLLLAEIERLGFRHTRGGRFFHIIGESDKARAVQAAMDRFRRAGGEIVTLGLGDAPNDLSFLSICDRGVMVKGPADWNREVLGFLALT
jgi:mannosyl-3-phosphoglycerate phosphatase